MLVPPLVRVTVAGVIVMELKAAALTVSVAEFDVKPRAEAVIVVVPAPSVDAIPVEFIVAIVVLLDDQTTEPEILPVELSENVPVAVKVEFAPLFAEVVAGAIAIPDSVAVVTLTATVPAIPFNEADTFAVPEVIPAVTPVVELVVAMPLFDEDHVTMSLRSVVEPSEYIPVADK